MKSISKKVLSVFVALVLVLGTFSIILPTNKLVADVKAEGVQQTFDYCTLLADKPRGTYLADTRILQNADGIDSLGIFNSLGIAVRGNGTIGVYDNFFTGTPIGAKADEIHPYVVYNVVPGTSFKLSSAGYSELAHKNSGCADDERFFNFYVSNDGVTWIPMDSKKERIGVWALNGTYDEYTYTIDNVGLKTNFVKVEYPMTMASRRTPDYVYFPNESLTITSVTLTKPETYNANSETLFKAYTFSLQKELYEKYFIAFPEYICNDNISDPTNMANHYKAGVTGYGDLLNKAWGTFEDEKARSFVTMVEPGSRFYLETANQNYMYNIGKILVNKGEIASADLARIRVYSSSKLSDNASDWTEWQPMEYTIYGNVAYTPTFNFILPSDHVYVRIVYPHKGALNLLTGSDGATVTGEVGNTGCFFNDMAFTPYVAGQTHASYDYTVSGTKGYSSSSGVNESANGLTANNNGQSKNLPNGHPQNTGTAFAKGKFSTTYAVSGGEVFSLEYAIRNTAAFNGYGTGAYNANATNRMGFELSVSNDGKNWYNAYKTESGNAQTTGKIGTSSIYINTVKYLVDEGAKFVRVDFDLMGNGYIYTNAEETATEYRYFNDAMYLRKVSIADATNASNDKEYVYTVDTEAKLGTISNNDNNSDSDLGKSPQNGVAALSPSWTYLKENTAAIAGTLPRAYVVYDIQPGTTFKSDYSMRYQTIQMSEITAQKNVNEKLAGAKQELVEYEFFIYGKSKNSNTWQLFGKTDSDKLALGSANIDYNTFGYGSFSVDFPDYVEQVKIEFPQTGGFYTNLTNYTDVACGNDGAYLYNMQFVAPGADESGVYYGTKESANIASVDKKNLQIYHFGGVSIANSEGLKAKTNNAFVIYKIKEDTILTLKSKSDLSFEYSTDDFSYKPFKAARVKGGYKIPAITGRNYIKVKLDSGEAISFANAELVAPTAKFYIPYLNKYEFVDYADYGSTANSVSTTLATLRPGYTFTGWSGHDSTEQIYIDTVYEATFVKSDELDYTVSWTVNGQTQTKTGVKFDDKITITAPRENNGQVFVKWVDGKRKTVSDNPTFSFLASGSISLTAVYADSKEDIDPYIYMTDEPVITVNDNGTWNMSVIWRTAMPKGVTIMETGILLGTDEEKAGLVFWDGKTQSGTAKMQHNNTAANKTAMYTVKNIKADNVRTALPYARLSTGAVIYADNVLKVNSGKKVTTSSFDFYGSISPEVLSNYLDRSLTYTIFDTTGVYSAKDVIRQTDAKYFARAFCHWTPSGYDDARFETYKKEAKQIHQMDPEIILEACIFETCGPKMNEIAIPAWVFEAFGKTPETRNFDYTKMAHQNGYLANNWGPNGHVPSISTDEFKMFVYYRACRYIDMGVEALHMGQMNLIGSITEYVNSKDGGYWDVTGVDKASWTKVIDMITAYAKENARRGYVIINGHYPDQDLTRSDDSSKMLVDFNMFPLRLAASGSDHHANEGPQVCTLNPREDSDAPYSVKRQANVKNKVSPSGYIYDSYPYLLEFDNYGHDKAKFGRAVSQWGFDEISWYANQPKEYRHQYLIDILNEVKNYSTAPNGHVALPGRRTVYIHAQGCSEYLELQSIQDTINTQYWYEEDGVTIKSENENYGIGVQIGYWDISEAGDVLALKAAWESIGSYGNHYDYNDDEGTDISVNSENKFEYGISNLGGIALVNNEKSSDRVFRGLHPGWGSLGADWVDTTEAPYVIYKVKPGTVMNIDLYLYQSGKQAFEKAGHDFDFKIEASASISGGWKNAKTTDNYATSNINIFYNVPADCKYVKITFPQKGKLSGTNGARGNDYARLMGVKFISE